MIGDIKPFRLPTPEEEAERLLRKKENFFIERLERNSANSTK